MFQNKKFYILSIQGQVEQILELCYQNIVACNITFNANKYNVHYNFMSF
jgi:hypothetical protein